MGFTSGLGRSFHSHSCCSPYRTSMRPQRRMVLQEGDRESGGEATSHALGHALHTGELPRQQAAGSRQQAAGSRQQAAGSRQQAAGSRHTQLRAGPIHRSHTRTQCCTGPGCRASVPAPDAEKWPPLPQPRSPRRPFPSQSPGVMKTVAHFMHFSWKGMRAPAERKEPPERCLTTLRAPFRMIES